MESLALHRVRCASARSILAVLITVVLALLAACGGDGGGAETNPEPPVTLFFVADDFTHGQEMWVTDGTAAGTRMVKDINTTTCAGPVGTTCSGVFRSANLRVVNGVAYFPASDGLHGIELWKSDGTATGTILVKDVNTTTCAGPVGTTCDSAPQNLTAVGGVVYFDADDGVNGRELWKSDGTADGTLLVKDIEAGNGSSNPNSLTDAGGVLFFSAFDTATGYEPWRSDGTPAGTQRVADVDPAVGVGAVPTAFGSVNGKVYFSVLAGNALWSSGLDGSNPGPVLDGAGAPQTMAAVHDVEAVGNWMLYAGADGTAGAELFATDGTPGNTGLVLDIWPGAANHSAPVGLHTVGAQAFFWANDGTAGEELWRSDGTTAGTRMVKDIWVGANGSRVGSGFYPAGDSIYFQANDGSGQGIWRSDGTDVGTVEIMDGAGLCIDIGTAGGGLLLFFYDSDDDLEQEPWITDGTIGGTFQLASASGGNCG